MQEEKRHYWKRHEVGEEDKNFNFRVFREGGIVFIRVLWFRKKKKGLKEEKRPTVEKGKAQLLTK